MNAIREKITNGLEKNISVTLKYFWDPSHSTTLRYYFQIGFSKTNERIGRLNHPIFPI